MSDARDASDQPDEAMPRRGAQALHRIAVVCCLALSALLLAADAQEYGRPSRAGVRVLLTGALPLFAIGAFNLATLDGARLASTGAGRGWRLAALVANVLLLGFALSLLRRGSPPFFVLLAGVAALLVAGSAAMLLARPATRTTRTTHGA